MITAFVGTDAFTGSYSKNPFNLKNCALNYLDVNLSEKSLPRERSMEPDFSNDKFAEVYSILFGSKGMMNDGNYISREDFPAGYTIYCINIDPSSQSMLQTPIETHGDLKIEARFSTPLMETTNILIYACFPHMIEIDATRNILWCTDIKLSELF